MAKKIIIIGGGFAGATAARILEKKFDVVLIDKKEYFEFTPGVLRTIVEPDHCKKLIVRHKNYLGTKTKIMVGEAIIKEKKVFLKKKEIKYDYLIIATGSYYESPIKDSKIVVSQRVKTLVKNHEKLESSQRVLIIGGGAVGVELAAEIITHYKDKKVMLAQKGELIKKNNKRSREYARLWLEKKGVKIINSRINKKTGNEYHTEKGKIKADISFLCTGIRPNTKIIKESFGTIEVDEYLRIKGEKNIFLIGDASGIKEAKLAQNAEKQARIAAGNIMGKKKKYRIKPRLMVISLGKNNGIIEYKGLTIKGLMVGILKRIIERIKLFSIERL